MPDTKKILIAEDEKPMANALMLKLNHVGFEAKIASNGQETLDMLEKEKFDLVLLDLMMPKVDGFGVLAELKNRGDKTPVIITSNLSQEVDSKRALKMGATDYIVKSDTPLVKIIEHVKKILN